MIHSGIAHIMVPVCYKNIILKQVVHCGWHPNRRHTTILGLQNLCRIWTTQITWTACKRVEAVQQEFKSLHYKVVGLSCVLRIIIQMGRTTRWPQRPVRKEADNFIPKRQDQKNQSSTGNIICGSRTHLWTKVQQQKRQRVLQSTGLYSLPQEH